MRLGALCGGALAFTRLPASVRRAIAQPSAASGLGEVRYVVLYMQENRSFDRYFGTLNGVLSRT